MSMAAGKTPEKPGKESGNPERLVINVGKRMERRVMNANERLKELEINCDDDSKLDYTELMDSNTESNIARKILVGRNSELTIRSIVIGSRDKSSETLIELEENAVARVKNIFIADGQKQNHTTRIIHRGRGSMSEIQNRGVLAGAELTLRGNIRINDYAEDSEGTQKSEMLIVRDSKAVSLPDLEINNDRVKCSHSSSITRLDGEKIFYLRTRGINEKDAKVLLVNAFIAGMVEGLEDEQRKKMEVIFAEKIIGMVNG